VIVRAGDLQPRGLQVDLKPDVGPLSDEAGLEIRVEGASLSARVVPTQGGLRCSGRLDATAHVPCSRCLEPYPMQVGRDFDVAYVPTLRGAGADEMDLQISREDLDVAYLDEDGNLDLSGLAAEQVYLTLPMKPLCADDCRGLCPGCGCNLNTESCHCPVMA
jgi:DUF177 domain-containing protein